MQNHDEAAVMSNFGAGQELTHGDSVEDGSSEFVGKYQQMHCPRADGTTVLYIGAEN